MSISEKRLKAIAAGEPFYPGEVVAMAYALLERLAWTYPATLPCPSFLNPASGSEKALALTWFYGHLRSALNATQSLMPWHQMPAQNTMPLSLNFVKSWGLVRQ